MKCSKAPLVKIVPLILLLFGFLTMGMVKINHPKSSKRDYIYVGTFSKRGSKGIYVFQFNRKKGTLHLEQTTTHEKSPSFVTITSNKKYLYAGCRGGINPNNNWGSVVAYKINQRTGKINFLNVRSAYGAGTCYVSSSPNDKLVFASNYDSGDLSVFKIKRNGWLSQMTDTIVHRGHGINPRRQKYPHVHSTVPSPNGKYVYASDLGTDKIYTYKVNYKKGTLKPGNPHFVRVHPGDGPRHLVFTKNSKYAYSVHEMGSAVTAYRYDQQDGRLQFIKRYSTLPKGFNGKNKAAEIHLGPKNRFLYISNRGANDIVIYKIDESNGKLTGTGFQRTYGKFPRNFIVDPMGQYVIVANRHSDNLVVFKRNTKNGMLTYTGEQVKVPSPVCVKWLHF